MAIDWKAIAKQLDNGNGDTYSTPIGRRALEIIVGEENIRDAVDHWISQEPGCFAAESVLSIMRPKLAMDRCYEIYKTRPDSEDAIRAVFLLTSFADDAALPWIREFLDDGNRGIRWNGLMVLRTILDGPLEDAAFATGMQLLNKAEQDSDPEVRERALQIRSEFTS
jgi:HEAT repeats